MDFKILMYLFWIASYQIKLCLNAHWRITVMFILRGHITTKVYCGGIRKWVKQPNTFSMWWPSGSVCVSLIPLKIMLLLCAFAPFIQPSWLDHGWSLSFALYQKFKTRMNQLTFLSDYYAFQRKLKVHGEPLLGQME